MQYVSQDTGKTVVIECRYCREFRDEHVPATTLAGQWEGGDIDDRPRWVPVCDVHFDGWHKDVPEGSRLPHFSMREQGSWREEFMGLFRDVTFLEPPKGSGLDEVLDTWQDDYDRAAKDTITERLEYLRSQIRAECISYSELAELQNLAPHIDRDDVELLEWAGVPEFPEEDE